MQRAAIYMGVQKNMQARATATTPGCLQQKKGGGGGGGERKTTTTRKKEESNRGKTIGSKVKGDQAGRRVKR